jgi:hypothetical protein
VAAASTAASILRVAAHEGIPQKGDAGERT